MNMREQADRLIDQIEAADSIVLFRHVMADGDAMGAQFALKTWIMERYPDKSVYAPGHSVGACAAYYPQVDEVTDAVIARSLAIVLDTATSARVDDTRWQLAAKTVRIDHHLLVERFCDEEIVDEQAAATCEILARLFASREEVLSRTCAQYLYSGLISDTINFTISSTSERTLQAAAYLLRFGVDVVRLQMQHFGTSLRDFRYESWLRSQLRFEKGVGHVIADQADYARHQLSFREAKEKVFVLSGIYEIEVWALFTQMEGTEEDPRYSGSLRSRTIALDDIANAYGGGGHRCACGIKNLSRSQIETLIEALKQRVQENK